MKTETESRARALAVAAELLDGAEVHYAGFGSTPARSVDVGDGRTATLRVVFDEDSGIGRWIGGRHGHDRHHDDVFGTFAWRGRDSCYGYPSERPAGFDGRAVVLDYTGARTARIDGAVWWQPTDDDTDPAQTLETVRAYLDGDWLHVGLVVELGDESESLWGVTWDYPDDDSPLQIVADLLVEAGLDVNPFRPTSADDVATAWARLLVFVAGDAGAPEFAARMARRGASYDSLYEFADQWREHGLEPPEFSGRLRALAISYANGVTR